jgi:hypothetical protein
LLRINNISVAWHFLTTEELNRSFKFFASGIVHSILQIDFKWKIYPIRAGINEYINTIAFGLILLILYSCEFLDLFLSCTIHFKFASGFMPSGLQIDFKWKICFIHDGNQGHINRTSYGYEIRTLYSWEFLKVGGAESLVYVFESAKVHCILQIDFKWKIWYILSVNKNNNNRTSIR